MQLTLDIPTLLLMTSAASIAMALPMAIVQADARKDGREDGLGYWSLSLVLHALGYFFLALRGQVPDEISILLANLLGSAAMACVLAAVCRFMGHALPWRRMVWPVAAAAPLIAVFLDDYVARLVIGGTLYPLQIMLALSVLWRGRRTVPGRGLRLVMLGMGVQAGMLLLRGLLAALGLMPTDGGLLQGNAMQAATVLVTFLVVLVASLGFIFMAKDRADEANRLLAAHDVLTGAANRRTLIIALDRDVARAVRTRQPLAVLMVDVDHFKAVNDTYGHLAGDHLLRHLVHVLRSRVRSQDLVGRYGGEEFLVLLPDTHLRGATELAQQLRQAVEQSACDYADQRIAVTVSIGVFGGRLEPGDSWDMLIHAADRALYAAKAAGRNRVEVAAELPVPSSTAQRREGPETFPASLH